MKTLNVKSLFALCIFSFALFAEPTETSVAQVQSSETNSYEHRIDLLNKELANLLTMQQEANGQDKLAYQLYMFRKNTEIRKVIEEGISKKNIDKRFFISQIEQQQTYATQRIEILNKTTAQLSENLNKAKIEDKLNIVTEYKETREFLDGSYQEQAENLLWLEKLGIDINAQKQDFELTISTRLKQVAANIELLKQKKENLSVQYKEAPEAEKEGLLFSSNIINKEMDAVTASLQIMMRLADDANINTSQYKHLYFEATGSVTQDLLNKDVLSSIIADWTEKTWAWAIDNAPTIFFQLLVVVIILAATYQIAKIAKKILARMVSSKNLRLSQLMQDFFIGMSSKIVWIIGLLIALSQMGINLGPVLAGFGIAGVIIGFALQDTLSNFAAGMMLLIYRPFDVGDFVLAGGVEGKVSHMSLVNTTIKTFDNQIIIVPNSKIWGDVIKNVTAERVRRVDMEFGVSYNDDIEFVEKILFDIIENHSAVLKSPEPMIKVGSLGDSSVNFLVRPWVRTDDYWDLYWDVTREVKIRFDKEGITIPYPQQDVHFYHGVEKALYVKKNGTSDDNSIVKQ